MLSGHRKAPFHALGALDGPVCCSQQNDTLSGLAPSATLSESLVPKAAQEPSVALAPPAALARDAGAGGSVGNLPSQLGRCGGAPTFDCQCRSFLFLFVFARELGALKKKRAATLGSF